MFSNYMFLANVYYLLSPFMNTDALDRAAVYYLIKEHTTKSFPTSIYFKSTDLWFMDDPYSLKGSGKLSNS